MSTSLSAAQFQKRVSACLGAALEAWTHMLLYQRRVYPSATFTASTFLGVRSYVSRHPLVVAYISDTLQVAVPSLVAGVAQELAFTIVDQNAMSDHDDGNEEEQCSRSCSQDLKKYVLRFHDFQPEAYAQNNSTTMETIEQIERGLRDLVLSAHALEHGRQAIPRGGDESGVTFRLSLHVPEKDQTCSELNEAFATGAWYAPSAPEGSDDSKPNGRVIRPLHQFSEASFGTIQFVMLKPKKKATAM